jgi:hypothetical protein
MKTDSLEYKKEIWQFLEKIEPGKNYTVDNLCKQENKEAFIAAIKEYMDSLPWQGYVTFNNDYSKFYRMYPAVLR